MFRILGWFFLIVGVSFSKIRLSVMDFEGNLSPNETAIIVNKFIDELHNIDTSLYEITTKSIRDKVLKEQEYQQSGCTDGECAIEIGQLINVEQIIVGSIYHTAAYTVSIKVLDVRTGKVLRSVEGDYRAYDVLEFKNKQIVNIVHDIVFFTQKSSLYDTIALLKDSIITLERDIDIITVKSEKASTDRAYWESRCKYVLEDNEKIRKLVHGDRKFSLGVGYQHHKASKTFYGGGVSLNYKIQARSGFIFSNSYNFVHHHVNETFYDLDPYFTSNDNYRRYYDPFYGATTPNSSYKISTARGVETLFGFGYRYFIIDVGVGYDKYVTTMGVSNSLGHYDGGEYGYANEGDTQLSKAVFCTGTTIILPVKFGGSINFNVGGRFNSKHNSLSMGVGYDFILSRRE